MIQLNFYSGKPELTLAQAHGLSRWEERVGNAFGGFTKVATVGNWEGEFEDSLLYIIVFEEIALPTWEFMGKQAKLSLAEALGQDEVLVTWVQIGGLL